MVRFSEHCELCATCPSLNHRAVHHNRSSHYHPRGSREARGTNFCEKPTNFNSAILVPIIAAAANLTVVYTILKFTTFTNFCEKPTNYNSAILVRIIAASWRASWRAANLTVLYTISKFTTYTNFFEKPTNYISAILIRKRGGKTRAKKADNKT